MPLDDKGVMDVYLASAWRSYHETIRKLKRGNKATQEQGAYLPNPDEIEERKAMMQELRDYGFNECFISSIMIYDTPNIERVRQMVARYGADETWQRCRGFISISGG